MKLSLFRTKSNASSPSSRKGTRLSNLLSSNRSKVEISDPQPSSPALPAFIGDLPSGQPQSLQDAPSPSRDLDAPSSDLPPHLPPISTTVGDSSFLEIAPKVLSSQMNSEPSGFDEQDMTRKLMDVESSFVPETIPASHIESSATPEPERWPFTRSLSPKRTKDAPTYLRYGSREVHHETTALNALEPESEQRDQEQVSYSEGWAPASRSRSKDVQSPTHIQNRSWYTTTTPPELYQTAATRPRSPQRQLPADPNEDGPDLEDSSFTFASQQNPLSSPITAAAQRKAERVTSGESPRSETMAEQSEDEATPKQMRKEPLIPVLRENTSSSSGSIQRPDINSNVPDLPEMPRVIHQERPSALHNRQFSHRSFASSQFSLDGLDENVHSTDYALQTGGAVSTEASTVRPVDELSRLPSFGSVASSIGDGSPQKVVNEKSRLTNPGDFDELPEENVTSSRPETPRAKTGALVDPTDTVLAQHVRDVHVPDTIAKEYRASHILPNATDIKSFTPPHAYGTSSLTLKEQNSKIDKLSKENFDLKLKIHFLHQALQDRSDEGVRDIISRNAQYQAELVKAKKDNQALRRRIRELEKRHQEHTDAISLVQTSQDGFDDDRSMPSVQYSEVQDERTYFKDRAQLLEMENEKLIQVWQGVLNEETGRRKRVEKELQDLQGEVMRVKELRSPLRRLKLRRNQKSEEVLDGTQSESRNSESTQERNEFGSLSGTTVAEQLRQENADLRRDLGAQTSMLSSRNRERERLQQEIEGLKLVQRRGDGATSVSGDSILDRSVSRAQQRPISLANGSREFGDAEQDHYESMQAHLRDENTLLRMRNQDMQRDLNTISDLRTERDEVTLALQEADSDIEQLSAAIKEMQVQLQQKEEEIVVMLSEIRSRNEESEAFRQEIKEIGDHFNGLVEDREASRTTIESLQQDLTNANAELDAIEKSLRDATAAKERLEVQQESSQSEIAFLREEQEGDKMKIGDLQSALNNAKAKQRDDQRRLADVQKLEADFSKARDEARRLRDALSSKEADVTTSAARLEELENSLRKALGRWDGNRSTLLGEVIQMRRSLESRVADLADAKVRLAEKEDMINEREVLLEASNQEIRRLTDLINTERMTHKIERAELERRRLEAGGKAGNEEALMTELEYAHSIQMADLEQKHTEQLHERNALLLTLWTRLSSLCGTAWAERHAPTRAPSLSNLSQDLPGFNKNISLAVKQVENIIKSFRKRIQSTEEEIWQDFQALEQTLKSRSKRLEQLERMVQQPAAAATATTTTTNGSTTDNHSADLARLTTENNLLRRELKQLKQTPFFSLPGLPLTQDPTAAAAAVAGTDHNPTAPASPRSKRHSVATGSSALLRTSLDIPPDPTTPTNGGGAASPSNANPGAEPAPARPISSLATTSTLGMGRMNAYQRPSQRHSNSYELAPPPARPGSTVSGTSTTGTETASDAGAQVTTTSASAATDQRYVLRLAELQKRLNAEREGRLLDRDGARVRLLEGRREVEGLKKLLARERGRNGGAVVEGEEVD